LSGPRFVRIIGSLIRRTGGGAIGRTTLIGLDIEGEWNKPLLTNAAEMSEASFLFADSTPGNVDAGSLIAPTAKIGDLSGRFDHLLACEVTKRSRTIYAYPAPRGNLGVIVGNEKRGITNDILKNVDEVVSIPMFGKGMTSVNVAVAAAIILYALERDIGRRDKKGGSLVQQDVDVLLLGPSDPSELGSLLRSAWAFGWRQVFLEDRAGVWFTKDRSTVLAGRAAARCEVNRIMVRPRKQLILEDYDRIIACGRDRIGTPLSRLRLPERGKVLLVYGDGEMPFIVGEAAEQVYVDHVSAEVTPCFRHAGSILLSMISHQLRRGRRG
jgi:tRNA C32,U32 (ribose-2'-O)-methylase TrmJ